MKARNGAGLSPPTPIISVNIPVRYNNSKFPSPESKKTLFVLKTKVYVKILGLLLLLFSFPHQRSSWGICNSYLLDVWVTVLLTVEIYENLIVAVKDYFIINCVVDYIISRDDKVFNLVRQ